MGIFTKPPGGLSSAEQLKSRRGVAWHRYHTVEAVGVGALAVCCLLVLFLGTASLSLMNDKLCLATKLGGLWAVFQNIMQRMLWGKFQHLPQGKRRKKALICESSI